MAVKGRSKKDASSERTNAGSASTHIPKKNRAGRSNGRRHTAIAPTTKINICSRNQTNDSAASVVGTDCTATGVRCGWSNPARRYSTSTQRRPYCSIVSLGLAVHHERSHWAAGMSSDD